MADKDFTLTVGADISDLVTSMQVLKEQIAETAQAIQGSFASAKESLDNFSGGIGGTLGHIKEQIASVFAFTGIAIGVEAFHALGSAIESVTDRAIQLSAMSDVLGVTVTQLQTMQLAAEDTGVSTQVMFRAVERLTQLLAEARTGTKTAVDTIHDLGVSQEQLSDPTFTNVQLLQQLRLALNDSSTSAQIMTVLTKELGLRGAQAGEAIKSMDLSSQGVAKAMREVNGLSDVQVARLKEMGTWWKEVGTWIGNASDKIAIFIADTFKLSTYTGGAQAVGAATKKAADDINGVSVAFATAVEAPTSAVTATILASIQQQIAATKDGTAQRLQAERLYLAEVTAIYGAQAPIAIEAQTKVVEAQRALNEQAVRDQQKAEEEKIRAIENKTQIEERQITKLQDDSKKILDEQVKAATDASETQVRLADLTYTQRKTILETEVAEFKITKAQQLKLEQQFEAERYAAQIQALAQRLSLEQASGDVAGMQKTFGEEQIAAQQYANNILTIQKTAATNTLKIWQDSLKSVSDAFAQGFSKVLTGQTSVYKAMIGLLQDFEKIGIQVITGYVQRWILGQLQTLIGTKTTSISDVFSNAAVAASGAYAATAAIPLVGPELAPAAAAEAFSGAASWASAVSAAGGYDIPAGLNPVAQLHEREMVLPQGLADHFRALFEAIGSGRGGAGNVNVVLNHSSPDPAASARFMMDNKGALAKALKRHVGGNR